MDDGSLVPHRLYGGKGGTREGKLSMPIGEDVSTTLDDAGAGWDEGRSKAGMSQNLKKFGFLPGSTSETCL